MKLSEILPDLEKRAAGAISPVHMTYHSGCVRHHRTGHLTTIVAWPDGRVTAYSGHPMSWRASLAHSKVSSFMLYRLKITADSGALGRIVIREPLPYEQRMDQELNDNPGDLSGFAESLEQNHGI